MPINPLHTYKISELVTIFLANMTKIVGQLHLPPNTRLVDMLNLYLREKPFIPLTNVEITYPNGEICKLPLTIINKTMVMLCFAQKDVESCTAAPAPELPKP